MDVKAALATLGWRTNTDARYRQAVKDFQRGWNLGPALTVDGNAGPRTVAALTESLARKAKGLPDFSAHFSAVEFRCECAPIAADCRRIWVHRDVIRAAEKFRTLVGPFSPVRGCRCPTQNAKVNGARTSQHLYGNALDLPVYNVTASQVKALGVVSGIGVYIAGGRRVVRHIDLRHLGPNTTGGTIANPTTWDYGTYTATPLTPKPVTEPSPEEDDMFTDADRARQAQLLDDADGQTLRNDIAALSKKVDALATVPAPTVTPEMLTEALRTILREGVTP